MMLYSKADKLYVRSKLIEERTGKIRLNINDVCKCMNVGKNKAQSLYMRGRKSISAVELAEMM